MKRIFKKSILAAALVVAAATGTESRAQSLEPFSPYGRINPSVESFSMTKYGTLIPSMYTGTMTFSVPVFTYSDPDFTIPISLDYNFEGYRPSLPSGTVGLGWNLNCGGVITREMRGMPDDYVHDNKRGYFFLPKPGTYSVTAATNTGFDSNVSEGNVVNLMAASPCYVSGTQMYDTVSDVYHISFLGHSGDFVIGDDGETHVFNSDIPYGEIDVDIEFNQTSIGSTRFLITLGDGTVLLFTAEEYSSSQGAEDEDIPALNPVRESVTGYRLKKVTTPNGRKAEFYYCGTTMPSVAVSRTYTPSVITEINYSPVYSDAVAKYIYSISCSSLLSSIRIDNHEVVRFNYQRRPSDKEELDSSHFIRYPQNSILGLFPVSGMALNYSSRLTGIEVRDFSGATVQTASLSQTYGAGGSPKMFLSGVSLSSSGQYTFSYDLANALPMNDCLGVDHWGFWNGQPECDLPGAINQSNYGSSGNGNLYNQLNAEHASEKEPSFIHARTGALTRIDYPTGGSSSITYEPHDAGKRIQQTNISGGPYLENAPSDHPCVAGGVRVRKICNVSSEGFTDSLTLEYKVPGGTTSSGILMRMPRYSLKAQFVYHYTENATYQSAGYNPTFLTYTYNTDMGVTPQKDGHIAYSTVTVRHSDGSREEHDFNNYDTCPDIYGVSCIYGWLANAQYQGSVIKNIFCNNDYVTQDDASSQLPSAYPPAIDRSSCRGREIEVRHFGSDGTMLKKSTNTFSQVQHEYCDGIFDAGYLFVIRPCFSVELLDGGRTETKYESGGTQEIVTGVTIGHNTLGQATERHEVTPTDTVATYYRYLHEVKPGTSVRAALSAAVKTRTTGGLEHIIAAEQYGYTDRLEESVLPDSIKVYRCAAGVALPPSGVNREALFRTALSGAHRTSTFDYDAFRRLTAAHLPAGASLTYIWDPSHRYITSRSENGSANATAYEWKDLVGVSRMTSPSGTTESYTYDSGGRLDRIINTNGKTVNQFNYNFSNE